MTSPLFPGLVALGIFLLFKKLRFQKDKNDTNSSIGPLPSPPTSLSQNQIHHVFPSFHGADVRKTILSHILASFKQKGIYPFIDNDIDRSKSIGPELQDAIRSSKIAIILLSKNYASSSWCLNELAEIINCREVLGQIVMTVFYEVDPTDVKKQAGDFGKVFKRTCKGRTKEDIEKWRKALEEVATIAGEHSRNWSNEAAMIEKIASDVLNKLTNSTPSKDLEYYPGMRAHMERMLSLLRLDLDEVRMIGIWGLPGIGKTTIARVVFNQLSSSFQLSTIMVNVKGCFARLCFDEYNVQLQLQNQMLSQITNHKELKISHLGVASELLKDKKVLLVIDEVDHPSQLDALAGTKSWFGSGSRIIVTTEDRRLLKAHDINHIYKVKCPSSDEAVQIFCMHAFGEKHPPNDFYKLARQVLYLAGELPLGLKVLGSALRGKSKQEWEMILPRLKTSLDGRIESIIKFSYDALFDEDKYLFIYISCIFMGELPHKVEGILASQFPNVKLGLHILTEKSLIFIYDEGRIAMNGLVRQFGIETARKKFVRNGITKREILVDERDICEVLTEDTTDNNHLIAIKLSSLEKMEEKINKSDKTLKKMADLQFIEIGDDWISPCESDLQSLFFHSQKIRSLKWSFFGNVCLPSTFNTEFLVNLNLFQSKLQKLWDGYKVLKNLKWMHLGSSKHLKELPDLSTATKFEELILYRCESLVELPNLPPATKLRKLMLFNCSSLVKFPSSFVNFNNLEHIDLRFCRCLVELPFYIGTATNLQSLDLTECSTLVKLPSSIGNLINLVQIILYRCSSLVEIPFSIGNLQKLKELKMDGCSKLEALPTNINLESLRVLDLANWSQLKSFPEISTNLEEIKLEGCSSLVEIPSSIGNLQKLEKLKMKGCSKLEALPTNINLDSLSHLDLTNCSQLKSFPEISTNLEEMKLEGCSSLVEILSSTGNLQKLKKLKMKGCSKLKALPTSINLESLSHLDLTNCSQLKSFPEISTNVEELYLTGTPINQIPLTIMLWPCLRRLNLKDCNNLVSLPQFPDSLKYLDASNCKSLERLDCSFNNPNIRLVFSNCFKLNQEARDLIINTPCKLAVLPGTEVPACFNYCRGTGEGLVTIKLNESTHPTSFRFKVCVKLVKGDEETSNGEDETLVDGETTDGEDETLVEGEGEGEEETTDGEYEPMEINTMVKQNNDIIPCISTIRYIHRGLRKNIYIFEVETAKVTSTELVLEFKTNDLNSWSEKDSRMWKIEELGLMQI